MIAKFKAKRIESGSTSNFAGQIQKRTGDKFLIAIDYQDMLDPTDVIVSCGITAIKASDGSDATATILEEAVDDNLAEGTATGGSTTTLQDTNVNFSEIGVQPGDIMINESSGQRMKIKTIFKTTGLDDTVSFSAQPVAAQSGDAWIMPFCPVYLKAGTDTLNYIVTFSVTTNNGQQFVDSILVLAKDFALASGESVTASFATVWRDGAGAPANSLGNDGDYYLNTTNGDVYLRTSGTYAVVGNIRGPAGAAGATGAQGPVGDAGPQGDPGVAGANGNTVLYGAVDPTTEGVNGDFYINTVTNFIFGPKAAGVWPAGTSLIGPTGPQGPQGDPGAGTPAGLTTQLQYNNSGSFGGIAGFHFTGGLVEVFDSIFRVVDDADNSKKLAFQLSGITAANTRTITMVNFSGTMVLSTGALTTTRIPYSTTAGLADTSALAWDAVNQQLELSNTGSAAQPALMIGTSMGWYGVSATNMGLSISGVARMSCDTSSLRSATTGAFLLLLGAGSASTPSYSFVGDGNTGFYSDSADTIMAATGGSRRFSVDNTSLFSASGGYYLRHAAGSAATPTYCFSGDTNTGFYSDAGDTIKWSTAGVQKGTIASTGKMFIGGSSAPSAWLHLSACTTAANTSNIKMVTGALATSAEPGTFEYVTPYLHFTNDFRQRHRLAQIQQGDILSEHFVSTEATLTDTGLVANLVLGANYRFEIDLHVDADATGGFNVGLSGTSVGSLEIAQFIYVDNIDPATNFYRRISSFPGSFGGISGPTEGFLKVIGYIQCSKSGTLTVQFSQATPSGSSSILKGSTFEVTHT